MIPSRRHDGIGRELASLLDDWLRDRDPEELVAQTDGDHDGQQFARIRGFHVVERRFEQRLSTEAFDASPGAVACQAATRRCVAEGIQITTLDALRAQGAADLERRLYELETDVMADEPTALGGDPMSFEDWVNEFLLGHDPKGALIAVCAYELIALSIHWKEPKAILIATTGVRACWRGRGVAKALKLASVDYARRVGLPLRTMNNAANEPILRLNETCGFERVAIFTRWLKRPVL